MSILRLIVGLVAAMVVVVFGSQNTQAVTFHFLMAKVPSVPLVLALFVAMLFGVLLGWIVAAPGQFRRMRERRGLRGQIADQKRTTAAAEADRAQASSPR